MEENQRLSDLTRMLLSSSSFSGFLENLSTNPVAAPPQASPVAVDQRQVDSRQVRKDINPYQAQQQMQQQQQQQQHIGMTLVPEHAMDFSMLDLNADGGFSYQPQVFSVLSLPEGPIVDAAALSGKSSNFVGGHFNSEDEKLEMPIIERMPVAVEVAVPATAVVIDDEFDADPAFILFTDTPGATQPNDLTDITEYFTLGKPSKYTLVVDNQQTTDDAVVMAKIQRLCVGLDAAAARLSALTTDC